MHRSKRTLLISNVLAATCVVAGCASTQSSRKPLHAQPQPPTYTEREDPRLSAREQQGPTQQEVQQMLARLQALETANADLKQKLGEQMMKQMEANRLRLASQGNSASPAVNAGSPAQADSQSDPGNTQPASSANLSQASRRELLDALLSNIALGGESPVTRR